MKNKIIFYLVLLILLINTVNAEKYYVLDVNHLLGSVTFNRINLREIDTKVSYNFTSGFLIKSISFDNTELEKMYYQMTENKNYLIYISYNQNAARMEIYNDKNSLVMDLDVGSFSNTCGNNICDKHESYESCTKDCASGSADDFCDGKNDGICDPDCIAKMDADCKGTSKDFDGTKITDDEKEAQIESVGEIQDKKPNYLLWILLVVGMVILIVLFFVKKMQTNKTNSLKQYINENLRKGFTEQQINDALLREGYTEKEVEKAFRTV